jgi:NAD(P)-dependent dehydrogenase (short-subunit alcohol dehydrogenase family)
MGAAVSKTILISGTSSGFGALTARALADAGHTVYAGMRDIGSRGATAAAQVKQYAIDNSVDLSPVELDVKSEDSVHQAVQTVLDEQHRLDVLIHNAGRLAGGPAEAFTPEQFAEVFDTNVLGAQRLNREVLPHLREQQDGLLIWISSTSASGSAAPYMSPYIATKAAFDALASSYALEIARFGIESTIIVPGAHGAGTELLAKAAHPADMTVAKAYEARYPQLLGHLGQKFADLTPDWTDAAAVAEAIVTVVDTAKGRRPFRVHIDPVDDGGRVIHTVADRVRADLIRRLDLADLLHPR